LEDILQLWGHETITKEDIKVGFRKWNILYTEEDIDRLMTQLRFSDNTSGDELSRVERYANGHLFPIFTEKKNPFLTQIAASLGVTPSDMEIFDAFIRRVVDITTLAHQRNCLLYVDAEQSYM
jgi:hypothetical protein